MTTLQPFPRELGRILKDLEKLKRARLGDIKKGMKKLSRDIRKAKYDLPPMIPEDALAGMFFGTRSACARPLPRFGGQNECMPQLFKVYPEDFARAIDRVLPRLENESVARSFVTDLGKALSSTKTTKTTKKTKRKTKTSKRTKRTKRTKKIKKVT